MPQKNVFIVSKDVHLSSCWSVNKHLSVNMLFKYCLVWSVRRRVWKKKKKKSPPGFMLLLCPSTWGHNVSKNTSFLYSRNWKKYKTYVVAQSHPKNQDISLLCFIFFFISLRLFSSSFYCCIQKHHQVCATARRLPLARPGCVTSVTWHRDTAHWQ